MLISGSARRSRAAIARVLAITALALVPAAAAAEPAFAVQGCPTTGVVDITGWQTVSSTRGVTVCRGFATGPSNWTALVQIVGLADGAKLRLVSQYTPGQVHPLPTEWKFQKRTAEGWYNWIRAGNVQTPGTGRLLSTTNASFFADTSSSSSPLSLPEMTEASIRSWGWAFNHNGDAAWNALKRKLVIGTPNYTPQSVRVSSFPTHYFATDIPEGFSGGYDATVGFEPLFGSGSDCSRRTFLGVSGTTAYLLTTRNCYTLSQAQSIVQRFSAGATTIQLDGGGSTQTYSNNINARFGSIVGRTVPDVLAVYTAP
jgi:Phosphodiester glycosidase